MVKILQTVINVIYCAHSSINRVPALMVQMYENRGRVAAHCLLLHYITNDKSKHRQHS